MKRLFQRGLLLSALTLGLVFHLAAQSTLMTIYMNDGTEHAYPMTENDRVYFEDNQTLVIEIFVTGNKSRSDQFNLADIRNITCSEMEGVSEASGSSAYLSPNPVHNTVTLRNLTGRQTVNFYTLDGRLVKSTEVLGSQPIDISDLDIGLYLVKTEAQTLKMIKL